MNRWVNNNDRTTKHNDGTINNNDGMTKNNDEGEMFPIVFTVKLSLAKWSWSMFLLFVVCTV